MPLSNRGLRIVSMGGWALLAVIAGCSDPDANGDVATETASGGETESPDSVSSEGTGGEQTGPSSSGGSGTDTGAASTGTQATTGSESSSGEPPSETGGASSATGTETCGEGIRISEDSSAAICPPSTSTTERMVACVCAYDPALLDPMPRPTDSADLLYYVNRWHSIDPCFPSAPAPQVLQDVRETYINAVDNLEPEMLTQCGDYDIELVTVPAQFTDDDDRLRADAWTRPAPPGYSRTLSGEVVGRGGQVGFGPMFAAAGDDGISLYVISGFRSMTTQADLFEIYADLEGDPDIAAVYSAWPSYSEHQLGTTADVGYIDDGVMINPFDPLEADLHQSEAFGWIRANAHRFGVVTTYQPERVHVHQYKPEPWHLRFVGPQAADLMHACGLSTEEALSFRYEIEPLPEFVRMDLVYDAVLQGGWDTESCGDS